MINNIIVRNILLPCPMRSDVQVEVNQIYDLCVGDGANDVPMDVGIGGETDNELDHRERHSSSPSHLTHTSSPMHPSPPPIFPSCSFFTYTLHCISMILLQVPHPGISLLMSMIIIPLGMRLLTCNTRSKHATILNWSVIIYSMICISNNEIFWSICHLCRHLKLT